MIKIAICDDNIPITSEIENLLSELAERYQIQLETDVFFDGKTLYQHISSGTNYDLIYLDIEMDNMNGIDAAQLLRNDQNPTIIIYISAYETYYRQLFEVEPFRFILKPIHPEEFERFFLAAYKKISIGSKFFTYGFNQRYIKIPYSEIIYFESRGRYIIIHTRNADFRFISKLNDIESQLLDENIYYIRIHQSYLINPDYVRAITYTNVDLSNGCRLNISPKYQKKVRSIYFRLLEDQ